MRYKWEFWLGRAKDYWNWEFKGVLDDDYESRIRLCDETIEEIKFIKEFYESLLPEIKGVRDG